MRRARILCMAVLALLTQGPLPAARAETFPSPPVRQATPDDRFARVLVFPGGGFQFAMFLGMLEGLESRGRRPDVIIGTCGGGIAAAIATTVPVSAERRALIESEAFFRLLQAVRPEQAGLFSVLGRVWSLHRMRWFSDRLPDVFTDTLVSVPGDISLPALEKPFGASGIRAVIIAARLDFGPGDAGQPRDGRKVYQQVYFTDPDTAERLRGLESPIARLYPDSAVQLQTAVSTGHPPMTAARASITDPYYVNPIALDDGRYYLTGAIDLHPLETAHRLGKEVTVPFSAGSDTSAERRAFLTTFRYDFNARLRHGTSGRAAHWIDTSDSAAMYDAHGFDPRLDLFSLSVRARIPERYEEYRRKVAAQWDYGRERALEALRAAEGSKAHIRVMDDTNSTRALRCRHGREECREPIWEHPTS